MRDTCLLCRQPCRAMYLKNLSQDTRSVLATDAFRQLALTAQAVQWQFGQNMLNLTLGNQRLEAVKRQQETLRRNTERLKQAIAKLAQENAALSDRVDRARQAGRVGASPAGWGKRVGSRSPPDHGRRQAAWETGSTAAGTPPTMLNLTRGPSLFNDRDSLFSEPPQIKASGSSLFGDRPVTGNTTFTAIMASAGV